MLQTTLFRNLKKKHQVLSFLAFPNNNLLIPKEKAKASLLKDGLSWLGAIKRWKKKKDYLG